MGHLKTERNRNEQRHYHYPKCTLPRFQYQIPDRRYVVVTQNPWRRQCGISVAQRPEEQHQPVLSHVFSSESAII